MLCNMVNRYIYLRTYLLTYLLTYSMEQSPSSEANWFAASQQIPHILWNLKVHYRIHKCPPSLPILSQLDPVHTPTSHFLNIHLNIILPSKYIHTYIHIPKLQIMSHYTNETITCHFLEVSSLLFKNVSSYSQVTKS